MDGHEKRRNSKKEAIIQAALDMFGQHGFDKVSLSEIADKAHVSRASIYNFFGAKEELRRAIVKGILDSSREKAIELINDKGSFVDKISKYIQIRTWYYGKHSVKFFLEAVDSDTELKRVFDDFIAFQRQHLKAFIDEGKACGVFSPSISNMAIEMYLDIFQSYYVQGMQDGELRDKFEKNPNLAQEMTRLFLDGLIQEYPSDTKG
ncbi:MAG: TetR/AcrR family transcriptional regulator [Clostridiales bacterium]|nr:TetR/AcrR family transcriptional regulator [Clostridiales bacterium]MDR2751646.1 TetR/AcrR family transcriptional regulator [Clostridiales bacterium]